MELTITLLKKLARETVFIIVLLSVMLLAALLTQIPTAASPQPTTTETGSPHTACSESKGEDISITYSELVYKPSTLSFQIEGVTLSSIPAACFQRAFTVSILDADGIVTSRTGGIFTSQTETLLLSPSVDASAVASVSVVIR